MLPRISAQSSVLHKPVPNFCLKDLEHGQFLIWDEETRSFVNASVNDIDFDNTAVIDAIRFFTVVGNGTAQSFTLPWKTSNKSSLIVTIQGVKQQGEAYNIISNDVSTLLTLAEPLLEGEEMELTDPATLAAMSASDNSAA